MARSRTIEATVWQHPLFRRQPWFVRECFLFLFSAWADDEGRFHYDAISILEEAFPRSYPVTEADIELALQVLSENGIILSYGDKGQYGWLTGWYEHQYIDPKKRSESALPAPPVLTNSWSKVDAIKAEYCAATGKSARSTRGVNALRWHGAEPLTNRARTVHEPCTVEALDSDSDVDVDVDVDSDVKATDSAPEHGQGDDLTAPEALFAIPAQPQKPGNGDTRSARGPSLKGNLAAIRQDIRERQWPEETAKRFLYALRDTCAARDTIDLLLGDTPDDAAEVIREVLARDQLVDVPGLATHNGRSWFISRLVKQAAQLAVERANT